VDGELEFGWDALKGGDAVGVDRTPPSEERRGERFSSFFTTSLAQKAADA
jgi:hypothetical protein